MSRVPPILQPESAVLLIVDVQERLMPTIYEGDACVATIRRMIEAMRILSIPILATEQYPAGLGPTCALLREVWGEVKPIEKMRFSACAEGLLERFSALNRSQVIVVGIETHVCVQQTVLDLLRLGHTPYVCADAVSSRRAIDRDNAIERMRRSGAVVSTTESVIFELVGEAGTDLFKKILKLVK